MGKRFLIFLLSNLLISACTSKDQQPLVADRVLTNGKIFTVDDTQPWAEAVAIQGKRFIYVGENTGAQAFVGPETTTYNLDGKLVIPGLVDAHT
ncbi:uncharacterized protein METZ01_LOCUS443081, partial [marine metagenome]